MSGSICSFGPMFMTGFKAEATNARGERALAEYTVMRPSDEPAHLHFLLDASGSTYKRVKTGDKKRVYKHLLRNFEHLVECEDTLRPHDVVYVWTFNTRVQLLCHAERRSLRAHLPDIRAAYKREFDDTKKYYRQTRLYDAIGVVVAKIREEYIRHKKADYFLVTFTDGEDIGSETKTLNSMMNDVNNSIGGRLRTIFITANMAPTSELYQRLQSQENEINVVDCEKMEPHDITRAFNTLRELIKVLLVVIHQRGGEVHMTRVANYGHNTLDAVERMILTVQSLPKVTKMLDGFSGQMKGKSIAYTPHKK